MHHNLRPIEYHTWITTRCACEERVRFERLNDEICAELRGVVVALLWPRTSASAALSEPPPMEIGPQILFSSCPASVKVRGLFGDFSGLLKDQKTKKDQKGQKTNGLLNVMYPWLL